jgi:hypothetical protein
MINEKLIGKDIERSGCGLSEGTILALAWRDREKPQKTLVRIANLWAEI